MAAAATVAASGRAVARAESRAGPARAGAAAHPARALVRRAAAKRGSIRLI